MNNIWLIKLDLRNPTRIVLLEIMVKNSSEILIELNRIKVYCKTHISDLERWPSYFDRRYLEFLSYLSLFPKQHYNRVLELGCGIGYQSAFLAQISDEVIATDLPDEDLFSHAPGMKQAKLLHDQLNIDNVKLVGCSAEELPFEDDSFDMVFSSHVLEHIPDQSKALAEINRVLKPNGIHFCVVPTTAEKVYAFFNFYLYLIQRSVIAIFRKLRLLKKSNPVSLDENVIAKPTSKSPSILKYFPFPPPHGHYSHYLQELKSWTPGKWANKLTRDGNVSMDIQTTTQFNPLLSLLGAIVPKAGTYIHSITRNTEFKLGKYGFFKSIGLNSVMIIRKTI
jgi:ubiquinone/menaquinone biosynthesis C-methylase UbiE